MTSWVVALHTVLDTADPVTLCWAAVIRSVMLCPDIFCSHDAATKKRIYGLAWASFQIISRKNLRMGPPLGPRTCRTPLVPPTSVETIVRLCGSSTSGGRNKDSPTTAAKCWIVSAVKGGSELGDAAMAESTRWLIRPGCLPRSHPDVAHRIPAPSASSYVSTSRCCRCRCRRCGRKKGDKRRREMAGLLDQIFNHRSGSWPGCEDEAGRRN